MSPGPYPTYKPSGIPWLGDLPEHWDVLPGRACYIYEQILNQGMLEKTVLSLSYGQIRIRPEEKLHGLVPASFETYQLVEPDDIVCRPTDLQNDWNSLRFGLSRHRGIITSAYMRLRTRAELSRRYGYLLLHTYDLKKVFYGLGSGLRQNLGWTDFKLLPCLVPPLPEQTAIVRYLDHADRRIRRYVSDKRKLIALLEEEKQAVINRAVTRGLDPDVRLKPSGVEWLGDVPEHWEVLQLGRVIDLVTGFPFKSEGFSFAEGDIRLLRGVNVSPGRLRWMDVVRWPNSDCSTFDDYRMEIGDIVLGMDRPFIEGGVRVASLSENDVPALLLQRVARIRPRQELSSAFTLLLLTGKSSVDYLTPLFTGISVPHVSPEQIKSYRIALPSIREQNEIVDHIMSVSSSIQLMTERARRQIELLQEYRTRLIADVVTGKLDVREAAALLPDNLEDEDPVDEGSPLAEDTYGDSHDPDMAAEELTMESEVTI